MTSELRAISGKIIVIPDPVEDMVTEGGIHLPARIQDRPMTGKVVAVGPGEYDGKGEFTEMETEVGDYLFYSRYSGVAIYHLDVEYVVIKEKDVLATIDD